MDRSNDIPDSILVEAAEWLTTLASDNLPEKDRRELAAWLTRSPMHIEALLSASTLKARFAGELKAHPEWFPDVLAGLELDENVVSLVQEEGAQVESGTAIASPLRQRRRISGKAAGLLAAGLAVLVTGLSLLFGLPFDTDIASPDGWQSYDTVLGEQRSLVLDDGSVVELNTQSVLRVRFDAAERRVELISGEAIFDVVKDPARPFRVRSGDVTVEAIGTRFNVYRQAGNTVVTVVEGRVSVSPADPAEKAAGETAVIPSAKLPAATVSDNKSGSMTDSTADSTANSTAHGTADSAADNTVISVALELAAGEQVTVARQGAIGQATPVDIEMATAWTQRRIALSGNTLEEAAQEFNRYNRAQLTIVDPRLRERRITGVFNANDPDAFVAFIGVSIPVRVVDRADGSREIHTVEKPQL